MRKAHAAPPRDQVARRAISTFAIGRHFWRPEHFGAEISAHLSPCGLGDYKIRFGSSAPIAIRRRESCGSAFPHDPRVFSSRQGPGLRWADATTQEMAAVSETVSHPEGRNGQSRVYHSFRYQAKSWDRARRVVAKIEWHAGELFPRVGFVVTNLRRSPRRVIKFYNGRGTAEQWIKEGKNALNWTRLSCRRFKDNQVRLQLFALTYNLANFLRQLALPRPVRTWTLTTLRERLIKIGAKVVHHAKAVTFQLAEVAVPRALFAAILVRIGRLRAAPSPG